MVLLFFNCLLLQRQSLALDFTSANHTHTRAYARTHNYIKLLVIIPHFLSKFYIFNCICLNISIRKYFFLKSSNPK